MRDRVLALRSQKKFIDIPLIAVTAILVFFGLLALYDVSVVTAFRDFHDKYYYFKNQLTWASFGLLAIVFFTFFDYHKLLKISGIVLFINILLLILVLVPHIGTEINGARRWITIGTFSLQPSELAKLSLIFYEAAIITKLENFKIKLFDVAVVFFLPAFIVIGLVLAQPDLGTALILVGITLIIYFIGNGPILHFILAIPAALLAGTLAILTNHYMRERIRTFLNPMSDPQGASYQINQIITALSSGKLFGVGLGSARSKFNFIPEVHSDAIFAVIVEELGFMGAIILIGLFLFLIIKAIKIAKEAPDFQGKILAMGIVGMFSTQIILNLSSIVALVPLTGIPLPFISYGGSSLFIMMASIGILLNIRRAK